MVRGRNLDVAVIAGLDSSKPEVRQNPGSRLAFEFRPPEAATWLQVLHKSALLTDVLEKTRSKKCITCKTRRLHQFSIDIDYGHGIRKNQTGKALLVIPTIPELLP